MRRCLIFLLILAGVGVESRSFAQPIPAFSGAEGAGGFATGGRPKVIQGALQGVVYHVTTLEADPAGTIPGSLRYGMNDGNFQVPAWAGLPIYPDIPQSYDIKPRIIVFDVGGTIVLDNTATNSDIDITPRNFTLAGQTAPGGITIYGAEFNPGHREEWDTNGTPSPTNNLIIRNLAVRTHNANEKDAFWVPLSNSIVDHISGSWYTDEGVSITDGARDITLQHSIIGPGWNSPDGDGSQIEGKTPAADISVHHNLYLHNDARVPRVGEKVGPGVELDFRNNVIFNWNDSKAGYSVAAEPSFTNFVNNYYIGGPGNGTGDNIFSSGGTLTRIYQSGNFLDLDRDGAADGSDPGWSRFAGTETQVATPYSVPHGVTQTAAEALATVRGYVGSQWWARDFMDQRALAQVATFGQGSVAQTGQVLTTIDPADVSAVVGAPLQTRPAGYDSDNDGMPNAWEEQHGLDPNSPAGGPDWLLDYDNDGYVNVEEYINEAAEWPAPYDIVFTGGTNGRYEQITNWSITRSSPGEAATTTNWQPSRYDVAVINSGNVTVDSVGQHAGAIRLGTAAGNNVALGITGGWLKVEDAAVGPGNGEVLIGANASAVAALNLSGGRLVAKTLTNGGNGAFNFTGGVLSAETINFDLVNNGGTLSPGESAGSTAINGHYTTTSGALEIELASAASFDAVAATGDVVLGGELIVKLIGGFVPGVTDTFTIVTGSDILGSFANLLGNQRVNIDGAAGSFLVTIGEQSVTLSDFSLAPPVLVGDYNDDGAVDAADYVVWRKLAGTQFPLANETASIGDVDGEDYSAWQGNFGTAGGGGEGASVPEPMAACLAVVGAFCLAAVSRPGRARLLPSRMFAGGRLSRSFALPTCLRDRLREALVVAIAASATAVSAEVHLRVGTPEQGGQYATVQAAVDAVPASNTERYVIDIMPGTYAARVKVPSNKPFITLRGEDPLTTILTFNETANTPPNESTVHASTVVQGADFIAENLTFANSYGPGVQALAIYAKADRLIFNNCRFLGWQDTLRSEFGRHYFYNVYVEGSVDFIYGKGTAYFENSTLYPKSSGYIAAQAREGPAETNGYVFKDSTITGSAANNSVYLGRPWQAYSRAVFIDTKMGPVVRPEGWSVWSGNTNHLTAYFAEYNSMDLAGNPLNVSQRVSWSHQLTAAEAAAFSKAAWLGGADGWNPVIATNSPGDFNADGTFDAADFVAWRKIDGTALGYDSWRERFGSAAASVAAGFDSGGGSKGASVPEPAAAFPVLIAWCAVRAGRGARR